jgi:GNAT superfamily N-acetyltransferase
MGIEVVVADYLDPKQAADLVGLLNDYAMDPMGGAEPLSEYSRNNLAQALSRVPGAFSILCYVDGNPAGFANCFPGFSTFKCEPLVNIHDIAVKSEYRGRRLSQEILNAIVDVARGQGCCKITLEVLTGNVPAQQAYLKFGFEPYRLDQESGEAQFWQKALED